MTFDPDISLQIALDAEYLLPVNGNRWGIVLSPEYQQFKANGTYVLYDLEVVYRTIDFPVGIRYHINFNKDLGLYINGFFIPGFLIDINSEIKSEAFDIEIKSGISGAIGAGVSLKKFGLEARYYFPKSVTNTEPPYWNSRYQRNSLTLLYQLW